MANLSKAVSEAVREVVYDAAVGSVGHSVRDTMRVKIYDSLSVAARSEVDWTVHDAVEGVINARNDR